MSPLLSSQRFSSLPLVRPFPPIVPRDLSDWGPDPRGNTPLTGRLTRTFPDLTPDSVRIDSVTTVSHPPLLSGPLKSYLPVSLKPSFVLISSRVFQSICFFTYLSSLPTPLLQSMRPLTRTFTFRGTYFPHIPTETLSFNPFSKVSVSNIPDFFPCLYPEKGLRVEMLRERSIGSPSKTYTVE